MIQFNSHIWDLSFHNVCCVQLESNGDPWKDYPDVDPDSVTYFWEYFYFVLVMLTTIGFGDIYPNTTLGKIFLVVYVLFCLVRCQNLIFVKPVLVLM